VLDTSVSSAWVLINGFLFIPFTGCDLAMYLDYGDMHTVHFRSAVRAECGLLQVPLFPPPRHVPKVIEHTREITKEIAKEIAKETRPQAPLFLRHEGGRGEKKRLLLTPAVRLGRLVNAGVG